MTSPGPHVRMQALQDADRLLGPLACVLFQPLRWARAVRGPRPPPRRILLIKFWGIGSLQLLTAAARTLRRDHPLARIDLLTLCENEAFARGLGVFDEVRTLDVRAEIGWRGALRLAARIAGLLRDLRRERFDRVYDFEFFTRFSALVSLLSGASETFGFSAPNVWRGAFHLHTVPFNRYWHVARNFRALAGGENGREIEAGDLAAFRVHVSDREAVPAGRYVVVNPNAGRLALERRWPDTSFAELLRRIALEEGLPVVLVGSAAEAAYVGTIVARAGSLPGGLLHDLSGRLTIGGLCAVLEGAEAVVSNDSGPMHLAAALGAPVVGLFGPETPVMYAPIGERAQALWKPPVCSPCINVHDNKVLNCIRGRAECLVSITVEDVLAATREALRPGRARPVMPVAGRGASA